MADHTMLIVEDEYEPVLMKLLGQARRTVDIMAYSFAIGSAGGKLAFNSAPYRVAAKLAAMKKVKIRLYLEGQRDTVDRNAVTAKFLKKAGVKVKFGATHAKGFCIDGKYVLFGSTNLTNQSMAKNNETNLFLQDTAVVTEFMEYFEHLWKDGKHGGVSLDEPMLADGEFLPALLEMIDSAKKRLEFSIYFFQQKDIEAALIRAHKRGVKIRGLVHNHFAFAMSYVRRTRATVERLRKAGIKDLHLGPVHLFTHSKYLIVDRSVLALGTGNWLDEDVEIHPQLYIRLEHAKIAKQLASHLNKQIKGL